MFTITSLLLIEVTTPSTTSFSTTFERVWSYMSSIFFLSSTETLFPSKASQSNLSGSIDALETVLVSSSAAGFSAFGASAACTGAVSCAAAGSVAGAASAVTVLFSSIMIILKQTSGLNFILCALTETENPPPVGRRAKVCIIFGFSKSFTTFFSF